MSHQHNPPKNLREEKHYGHLVVVHPALDQARREGCLCLSCEWLIPGDRERNCHKAQKFFDVCSMDGVAVAVTRCSTYSPGTRALPIL